MRLEKSFCVGAAAICLVVAHGSDAAGQLLSPRLFAPNATSHPNRVVAVHFQALILESRADSVASTLLPRPQQAAPPPTPEHTGFQALARSTGADFKEFPRRTSTWVILAMGGAGALAVHPADHSVNARIGGNPTMGRFFAPGKYVGLGYVQIAAAVGTYVTGRYIMKPDPGLGSHTNRVAHLGFDLLRAQILTQTFMYGIKIAVRRDRPTGECCSFPSGHAATTFATAAVLERHLGLRAAWPTIFIASYVAASRLYDNRHFLSDVVFGAALGTACGWTVVGRHGRSQYALLPIPVKGGVAVTLLRMPQPRVGAQVP
jgi:hypothetical protein